MLEIEQAVLADIQEELLEAPEDQKLLERYYDINR
jgi:hypothetical protein